MRRMILFLIILPLTAVAQSTGIPITTNTTQLSDSTAPGLKAALYLDEQLSIAKNLVIAGPIVHGAGLLVALGSIPFFINHFNQGEKLIYTTNPFPRHYSNTSLIAGIAILSTGVVAFGVGPGLSAGGAFRAETVFYHKKMKVSSSKGLFLYGLGWAAALIPGLGSTAQEILWIAAMANSSRYVRENANLHSRYSLHVLPKVTLRDGVGLRLAATF